MREGWDPHRLPTGDPLATDYCLTVSHIFKAPAHSGPSLCGVKFYTLIKTS